MSCVQHLFIWAKHSQLSHWTTKANNNCLRKSREFLKQIIFSRNHTVLKQANGLQPPSWLGCAAELIELAWVTCLKWALAGMSTCTLEKGAPTHIRPSWQVIDHRGIANQNLPRFSEWRFWYTPWGTGPQGQTCQMSQVLTVFFWSQLGYVWASQRGLQRKLVVPPKGPVKWSWSDLRCTRLQMALRVVFVSTGILCVFVYPVPD